MPPRLFIFDDGRGQFGPLTDLRAIFEQRTGALTTLRRIERVLGRRTSALHVPTRLAAVVSHRFTGPVNAPLDAGDWLMINGRWLGLIAAERVAALPCGHMLLQHDGRLIAAHLPHDKAQHVVDDGFEAVPGVQTHRLPAPPGDPFDPNHSDARAAALPLIDRPWHILSQLEANLRSDLDHNDIITRDPRVLPESRESDGKHAAARQRYPHVSVIGEHPFKAAPDAKLHAMIAVNTEKGAVVIDSEAEIHPFVMLTGPCYVGKKSVVQPHSAIRPNAVIGPYCKVGGEISYSILQGLTNKAHLGYLGHSIVGEWCNFGGDTNVSNLKNTYGSIRVQMTSAAGGGAGRDAPAEDTGRTFLGPIVGDFTLTAIGTRILSGSCIGTGTMLALSTFSPKFTEAFSFLTDEGCQRYDMEKFLDMARRMTSRRGCTLKPVEEELLRAVHQSVTGSSSDAAIAGNRK